MLVQNLKFAGITCKYDPEPQMIPLEKEEWHRICSQYGRGVNF